MIFRASRRHSYVSRGTKDFRRRTDRMLLKNKIAVIYGAGGTLAALSRAHSLARAQSSF